MLAAGFEKVKPEISYSWKYALTLTLLPKVRTMTAEEQMSRYRQEIVPILRKFFPNCKLTIVAELTKTYDVHFHGTIQFDMTHMRGIVNPCRYFRDKFRRHKLIGFVLLKVIDNEDIWKDYISKGLKEFYADTGEPPVLVDDDGMLNSIPRHF